MTTKLFFRSLIAFFLLPALVISCGNKTELDAETAAKNIIAKENPYMIFSMKAQDLLDKSGAADGSVFPATFKMMFGEMVDMLTQSSKNGIDFKGRSFLIATMGDKGKPDAFIAVYNLANPETFAKMLKEDMEVTPAEKDGYNYVISPDNQMAFGWYKTFGIILLKPEFKGTKAEMESLLGSFMVTSVTEAEPKEMYASFLKEEGDINVFISYEQTMTLAEKNAGNDEEREMVNKLKDYYKDSYASYAVAFETDKISGRFTNHLSEKAKSKFSPMFQKGISQNMMNFLTPNQLMGFFSASFSPKPFFDFIQESGGEDVNRDMDEFEEKTKLNLDELIGSFSGEMTFALLGMEKTQKSYTYLDENGKEMEESYETDQPVITAAFTLNNNLVKSITDTVADLQEKRNEQGFYAVEDDMFVVISDKVLFITTSQSIASEVAQNGQLKTYASANGIEKDAMKNPMFGYFDFKPLVASLSDKQAQQLMKDYDFVKVSGNMEQIDFEMHFRNTGKNSLYILTKSVMDTFLDISF
jgi:hypothetical protein